MVGARHTIPQEENCPVPEDVLGQLYRASSHGLNELVATIPAGVRAMLALYCYRRAHLQAIGLAVATSCNEFALQEAGGHAGTVLFEKARQSPSQIQLTHYQGRRKVTLSIGILKDVVKLEDDEIAA